MAKSKSVREKGKISFSRYLKEVPEGARVAVVIEQTIQPTFPSKIQGLSGVVTGSRGNYKIVSLKEGNKEKMFTIHPVHLKLL